MYGCLVPHVSALLKSYYIWQHIRLQTVTILDHFEIMIKMKVLTVISVIFIPKAIYGCCLWKWTSLCVLLNSKDKPIDFPLISLGLKHFTVAGWQNSCHCEITNCWKGGRQINNDGGRLSLASFVLCQGHQGENIDNQQKSADCICVMTLCQRHSNTLLFVKSVFLKLNKECTGNAFERIWTLIFK